MFKLLCKVPTGVFSAFFSFVVLYLCLAPQPLGEQQGWFSFPGADKVVHCGMFFVRAAAYMWDYCKAAKSHSNVKAMALIAVVAIAIGGLVEVAQGVMGLGRSMDMWDLLADSVGAIAAFVVMVLLQRKISGQHR